MSWRCSCGLINSSLNTGCYCKTGIQVTINKPDFVMLVVAMKGLNMESRDMTELEKKQAKFFNETTVFVADMDRIALEEHINELADIVFEGRARLSAATQRRRELNAGLKTKEWLVSNDGPDATVTDAINTIQVRKQRLSKMDKIRANLLKTLPEDIVNQMMPALEARATEAQVNSIERETNKLEELETNDNDPFSGSK